MKRLFAALAVTAGLVAACGTPAPTTGTVIGHSYSPAHDETDYIDRCMSYSKYGCSMWIPFPYTQHVNAAWSLDLRNCDAGGKCRTGWRDVSEQQYEQYQIGQEYP